MSPTIAQPAEAPDVGAQPGFMLSLDNFEGPFDLLLQLISRHKLDVTEVALSQVTDEFIAHITAGSAVWDLEQTSSFLVVAATLLDLKAARLIPGAQVEDVEDLAWLEARDLLFARLLQYRAFKQVAAWIETRIAAEARVFTRPGGLEAAFVTVAPEVELPGGVARLAALATRAFSAPEVITLPVEHLHLPTVSVQEQAEVVAARLARVGTTTFRALTADADRLTTVVRFLALLELFRLSAVAFEQVTPLGELTIRWTGEDVAAVRVSDEFDAPPPAADEEGVTG